MPLEKQKNEGGTYAVFAESLTCEIKRMPCVPVGEPLPKWEDNVDDAAMKPAFGKIPI